MLTAPGTPQSIMTLTRADLTCAAGGYIKKGAWN